MEEGREEYIRCGLNFHLESQRRDTDPEKYDKNKDKIELEFKEKGYITWGNE